jgi:hypothetical protein
MSEMKRMQLEQLDSLIESLRMSEIKVPGSDQPVYLISKTVIDDVLSRLIALKPSSYLSHVTSILTIPVSSDEVVHTEFLDDKSRSMCNMTMRSGTIRVTRMRNV